MSKKKTSSEEFNEKENNESNDGFDELLSEDDFVIYQDGEESDFKILFTYENEQRKAKYVFLYKEESPDDIYVFRYDEDGEVYPVEDEEEFNEAEEVLQAYNTDIVGTDED